MFDMRMEGIMPMTDAMEALESCARLCSGSVGSRQMTAHFDELRRLIKSSFGPPKLRSKAHIGLMYGAVLADQVFVTLEAKDIRQARHDGRLIVELEYDPDSNTALIVSV